MIAATGLLQRSLQRNEMGLPRGCVGLAMGLACSGAAQVSVVVLRWGWSDVGSSSAPANLPVAG